MGVIKNLWVRIGGDARGVVNCMKAAKKATNNAKESIKKSVENTKKVIYGSFYSSGKSIREYSTSISKTKENHKVAAQNAVRLKEEISRITSAYETVKDAAVNFDVSKPIKKQISESEKEIESIGDKISTTIEKINFWKEIEPDGAQFQTDALRIELEKLIAESDKATTHLGELERIAGLLPDTGKDLSIHDGLKELQLEINKSKNELEATEKIAAETGKKLKSLRVAPTIGRALKGIGSAAAHAAGTGVKKLGIGLATIGVSTIKGIAALPGKLLGIGKSASAGCGGLTKMVRSIRNIGIASLGMRVASGMFGRLRSVISSYLSQNEQLNASVTAMKDQMGAALAPAINLVLAAMQRLMPVVTAVSNAISSVFTALFGKVAATGKAITATAESAGAAAEGMGVLGFDQITKEEDNDSGGGGSDMASQIAEQSAVVGKLTAWIQELKAAFAAGDWMKLGQIVGNGINSIVASIDSSGVGEKIGTFTDNLFTSLHAAITTIDFPKLGKKLGEMFTASIKRVNWGTVGKTIGATLTSLPSVLVGFVLDTDWATVAQTLSTAVGSALNSVTEWIKSVDWLQLGQCIADFIANIDWGALATSLFELLGSALGATVSVLRGCIDDAVHSIGQYFTEKIDAAGGNIAQGLLNGILDGLANIGHWIEENIFKPFMQGFCDIFGIHSPADAVAEKSKFISEGILSGIKSIDIFGSIKTWFHNNILTPLTNGFGQVVSAVTGVFSNLWSGVRGWINTIIGGVESMVNGVINGINGLIRGINNIAEVGQYIGIDLTVSQLSTVRLPRLAKGAVVNEPTAAIIGEAGKEAVMPLENNTGWITKLAQQINLQGGEATKSLTLAIYFRNRKITEYVIQDINQITRETGVCPINM